MTRAWLHHGSDTPTSVRALLHHKDQKGPNILKGIVVFQSLTYLLEEVVFKSCSEITFGMSVSITAFWKEMEIL